MTTRNLAPDRTPSNVVPGIRKAGVRLREDWLPRALVIDMPELPDEVRALFQISGALIEIDEDEEIVARAPLLFFRDNETGEEGVVIMRTNLLTRPRPIEIILIAKREALPRLKITADDPRIAELAHVLSREALAQ